MLLCCGCYEWIALYFYFMNGRHWLFVCCHFFDSWLLLCLFMPSNLSIYLLNYFYQIRTLPPSKFPFKFTHFLPLHFLHTTTFHFSIFAFFLSWNLKLGGGLFFLPDLPENANLSPCGKVGRLIKVSGWTALYSVAKKKSAS